MGYPLSLNILADILLQQLIRHPEAAAGIEALFGKKEAVLAAQIACRSCGLGQQMKSGQCG
jgi:hypothetical protein